MQQRVASRYVCLRSRLVLSDDYNRVMLKLNEEKSHESDPEDDYDMSSDDDVENSSKYINASLLSVRTLASFLALICIKPYTDSSPRT